MSIWVLWMKKKAQNKSIWDEMYLVTLVYVCGLFLYVLAFILVVKGIKGETVSIILNGGSMLFGGGIGMSKDYLSAQIGGFKK